MQPSTTPPSHHQLSSPDGPTHLAVLRPIVAHSHWIITGHAVSTAAARLDASLCRALALVLVPALLLLPTMAHSVGAEPARALSVGEELVAETMPLRHVRRVYRIDGPRPRPSAWYEVKNDLLPGLRMIVL
uniref:Uncharacterized protein n=1 Tax=Zea mays TaxID=4577 RepID=A0A804P707_MAIZE